eukprot:scaffold2480_cov385-Prasinococcus_capsulatus_cf.AAC.14
MDALASSSSSPPAPAPSHPRRRTHPSIIPSVHASNHASRRAACSGARLVAVVAGAESAAAGLAGAQRALREVLRIARAPRECAAHAPPFPPRRSPSAPRLGASACVAAPRMRERDARRPRARPAGVLPVPRGMRAASAAGQHVRGCYHAGGRGTREGRRAARRRRGARCLWADESAGARLAPQPPVHYRSDVRKVEVSQSWGSASALSCLCTSLATLAGKWCLRGRSEPASPAWAHLQPQHGAGGPGQRGRGPPAPPPPHRW